VSIAPAQRGQRKLQLARRSGGSRRADTDLHRNARADPCCAEKPGNRAREAHGAARGVSAWRVVPRPRARLRRSSATNRRSRVARRPRTVASQSRTPTTASLTRRNAFVATTRQRMVIRVMVTVVIAARFGQRSCDEILGRADRFTHGRGADSTTLAGTRG
jgi:hypothetical protein